VILVDSCGWLEAIKGAGLAALYAPALARPDEVLVPTVCVLEVARVMCRQRGERYVERHDESQRHGGGLSAAVALPLMCAVCAGRPELVS
jgi:hypothetical protein